MEIKKKYEEAIRLGSEYMALQVKMESLENEINKIVRSIIAKDLRKLSSEDDARKLKAKVRYLMPYECIIRDLIYASINQHVILNKN